MHARLRALPDTADTLSVVARDLARDMRVLVLDEFFVGDIGDAMILGRLLEQLIGRGVSLVTTSNIQPPELYRDGLQRASFLPCIALIERHCRVWKLDSAHDYRLRELTRKHDTFFLQLFFINARHPTIAVLRRTVRPFHIIAYCLTVRNDDERVTKHLNR